MKKIIVSNTFELYKLLVKQYGVRFEADPLLALSGDLVGFIDSKGINITFGANKFLIISTDVNSRDILDELKPLLTAVMGDDPICSYDLQTEGLAENKALPTLEWDIVSPDKRIKEIVNGRAFSDEAKTHNLKLYNGKNVADYLETQEEKEERIKNARIYGIDPGCLKDIEKINSLNEAELFLMIDAMGGHIWRCRHDMSHGRIPQIDLTEEQYALEYLVYQTKKFGVELDEPVIDKHIAPTLSYKVWYSFYSNHFKKVLTDAQWYAFQQAQKNGNDISPFMPSGSWKDLLEQEKQKILKK